MSVPADALAAQVMTGLRESLGGLRSAQKEAADELYAGAHARAGARLKTLFAGWSEFLRAAREVLPAIDAASGARVQGAFAQTAAFLSRLNQALVRRDWVETADLLSLEGEGLLDAWSAALAGSPAPGTQ